MKLKSLLFLLLFFCLNFLNVSLWQNLTESLNEKQLNCFDLIKNEIKKESFNNFVKKNTSNSAHDGITKVHFLDKELKSKFFTKKTYLYGNKSKLSKWDLFKIYDIYWINLYNKFFYENSLNFYDIDHNGKEEFLSCSYTYNENLQGELSELNENDTTVAYTNYPKTFEVKEINNNGKKWKKIISKNFYKDKLGKKNVLQRKTIYFVPENKELENYYNLYNLVDKFKNIRNWFKTRVENISLDATYLKEIYNRNWLKIKRYFVHDMPYSDPYGIRYIFVNWINFFNDFMEYKRHNIFEYLVENNSPLAKNVVIVENKWNEEEERYVEPQLKFVWRIKFFLWDVKLTDEMKEELVDIQPYYTRERNYLNNTYYRVSDEIEMPVFREYMYDNLFNDENKTSPKKLISAIRKKSIEGKYKTLKKKYKNFIEDYNKINKSWSWENKNSKKEFIKKYRKDFSEHQNFRNNSELLSLREEIDEKEFKNSSNKETKVSKEKIQENKVMFFWWIAFVIFILLWIVVFLKKKSK